MTRQLLGIAAVLAAATCVYLLLAGCALPPTRQEQIIFTDCDGRRVDRIVETRYSNVPPIACTQLAATYGYNPLWTAIQVQGACTLIHRDRAIVILPPWAPQWLIDHEWDRVMGLQADGFLPFVRGWCPGSYAALPDRR